MCLTLCGHKPIFQSAKRLIETAQVFIHHFQEITGFGPVGAGVENQAADAQLLQLGNNCLGRLGFPNHPLGRMASEDFTDAFPFLLGRHFVMLTPVEN